MHSGQLEQRRDRIQRHRHHHHRCNAGNQRYTTGNHRSGWRHYDRRRQRSPDHDNRREHHGHFDRTLHSPMGPPPAVAAPSVPVGPRSRSTIAPSATTTQVRLAEQSSQVAGTVTITNSTFTGNNGTLQGGGVGNTGSVLKITNCTFSGNEAAAGAALYTFSRNHHVKSTIFAAAPAAIARSAAVTNDEVTIFPTTLAAASPPLRAKITSPTSI